MAQIMKSLIFLIFTLQLTSAETHKLQYFYTAVTSGINFPEFTTVGQVDGEQIDYYDNNTRRAVPKTDWIKKHDAVDPDYWNRNTQTYQAAQEWFKVGVQILMERFNQTKGVHTLQWMYGCELDDDGTKRGFYQYGYDGEDFLSLDQKTLTWTAANQKAVITKHKWDPIGLAASYNNYAENECIEWIKKYVGYGRSTLERKVPPKVSVHQKDSSSPVVCHATGFFPKAVMISWLKNGEDLHEDVELRETVPNNDGTFQKRSILTKSPEELKNDEYTCVVQHSSLQDEIVIRSPGGESDGGSAGVIIGVVVAVVLLAIIAGVGFFIWRRKQRKNRGKALDTSSERSKSSGSEEANELNPSAPKNSQDGALLNK